MICANSDAPSGTRAKPDRQLSILRVAMLGAALVAVFETAQAADVSDTFLRGAFAPSEFKRYNSWEGPYFGADIGRSQLNSNFSDNVGSMIHDILRTTALENEGEVSKWPIVKGSGTGNVWGGFVGYNWQMTDLVMGLEGAYHKASEPIRASGVDSISRNFTTSGGTSNDVTLNTSGRLQLRDYATIRGRAGYVLGQFLPYAGIGLSVARMSYTTRATVQVTQNSAPPVFFGPVTEVTRKENAVAYGANLALGVDVTLLPNLFLRGEYEYIVFAKTDSIRSNLGTFRAGLGLKF